MKYGWFVILAAVCMLLPFSAFGQQKEMKGKEEVGKFTLTSPAEVGSTKLAAGDYKAEWNGTGNDVQVNIVRNKQVVATAQGQVTEKQQGNVQNTVTVNSSTNKLEEIDFAKQKVALKLE